MPKRLVYLDHAATTATDPRVVEAMLPYFSQVYGNPSSLHRFGREASGAIDDARRTCADVLNCSPKEVVFTSGGSEADNLAVRGVAWARRAHGNHLVTTPIEHSAVVKTVEHLAATQGFDATLVPVDAHGMVAPAAFEAALTPNTTFASVMTANNEVGTVQPIAELAAIACEHGVWFHTDAVQAVGQVPLDVRALGVDLLSLSAHKFYGPKGVGLLYARDGVTLHPAQTGGSHERGLRAGTHNTPFIVGMAAALALAYDDLTSRVRHLRTMRDRLIEGVLGRVPGAQLSGHPTKRLPSHASFVFTGVEANMLLMHLDIRGVAASSASACKTGNPEPSGVLLAMGYDAALAASSLRLTVGTHTSEDDVDYAVATLDEAVRALVRQPLA